MLFINKKKLLFQNEEKEKRAAELVLANKELLFQNEEKEKRAAELAIANKELLFQNKEKEKRAAELAIANKELLFQNEEKEKRAAELIIANKELQYQNREKEKRAEELIIINNSLDIEKKNLKEQQTLFASIVDSTDDAILSKNMDGIITSWNYGAEKTFGYSSKDIIGKYISILIPPHLKDEEKRILEKIRLEEHVDHCETERVRKDGKIISVSLTVSPLKNSLGNIVGASIISRDITGRKNAEAEIIKLNKELEKRIVDRTTQMESISKELQAFSYSVAHDLRSPIRAINAYAAILNKDYCEKLDPKGAQYLHSVIRNSTRMGELIDDLLTFSQIGRTELTVSEINMNALVKFIKDNLLPAEDETKTEFTIKTLPPAKGDQALIKEVWRNLLSNAIKYSKPKPKINIEIGAYEKDNLVVYYVKDNGIGFDMKYYDKLFGVFHKLHSNEEFEGTGIGLAIVQKIVSRLNGTVWAKSEPNEGACFYFSLPSAQEAFQAGHISSLN